MKNSQGEFPALRYTILIPSSAQKALTVTMKITKFEPDEGGRLTLFKGKMPLKIRFVLDERNRNIAYRIESGFVIIGPVDESSRRITLTYEPEIGYLHKHGHQGYRNETLVVFAGENVLLIPVSGRAESIALRFDYPASWKCFLSADAEIPSPGSAILRSNNDSWLAMYAMMKSCYAFGKLHKWAGDHDFQIYFTDKSFERGVKQNMSDGASRIFNYFCRSFSVQSLPYSLLVLPATEAGEKIMGGVGAQSMGFTIAPDSLRDWQLLSHRLFHAFFDRTIHIQELYMPPNLWFLEGLACYFEITAPAYLPEKLAQNFITAPGHHFKACYRRYLYFHLKDPELFAIVPMSESDIQLDGRIEFLHYTQAPLVIFAMEPLFTAGRTQSFESAIINWLRETEKGDEFDLIASLNRLPAGREAMQAFAEQYITGSQVLNLWDQLEEPFSDLTSAPAQAAIHELEAYEALLWTWFREHPELFLKRSIPQGGLIACFEEAQRRKLAVASPEIELKLARSFPTVYACLKVNRLRMDICGIKPGDRFRNSHLTQRENLQRWSDYVKSCADGE
ncbi:hypothetical protein JXJ21_15085 [candidate division KSB1 bacterium]|nr:hypothetical protein [candidate division KSB1 bacterium]